MMFWDMHAKLAENWISAFVVGSKMVSDAYMASTRDTADQWGRAVHDWGTSSTSSAKLPWSWPDFGRSSYAPSWYDTGSPAWWSSPFTAGLPTTDMGALWQVAPWTCFSTVAPWSVPTAPPRSASEMVLQDAFATAYRSASGFATAAVLTAFEAPNRTSNLPSWGWGLK